LFGATVKHLPMLELMYSAVAGLRGKYGVLRADCRNWKAADRLYRQIRQLRGDVPRDIYPFAGLRNVGANPHCAAWLVTLFS